MMGKKKKNKSALNINQTLCASYCRNYECPKMLSYEHVRMAEHRNIPFENLDIQDLTGTCPDYWPKVRKVGRDYKAELEKIRTDYEEFTVRYRSKKMNDAIVYLPPV